MKTFAFPHIYTRRIVAGGHCSSSCPLELWSIKIEEQFHLIEVEILVKSIPVPAGTGYGCGWQQSRAVLEVVTGDVSQ